MLTMMLPTLVIILGYVLDSKEGIKKCKEAKEREREVNYKEREVGREGGKVGFLLLVYM